MWSAILPEISDRRLVLPHLATTPLSATIFRFQHHFPSVIDAGIIRNPSWILFSWPLNCILHEILKWPKPLLTKLLWANIIFEGPFRCAVWCIITYWTLSLKRNSKFLLCSLIVTHFVGRNVCFCTTCVLITKVPRRISRYTHAIGFPLQKIALNVYGSSENFTDHHLSQSRSLKLAVHCRPPERA